MLSSVATRAGEEGSWIRLWRRGVEGALGASPAVLRGFDPVVGSAMAAALLDMKRIFFRGTVGALNCLGMRGQVGGLRHGWLLAIVHEFLWRFSFSLCCG